MPRKKRFTIPLCRSAFLQDITIALGRRSLKGVRYANRTLTMDVTEEGVNGDACERLSIEARAETTTKKIAVWADGQSWIYFAKHSHRGPASEVFEAQASLTGMDAEEVADLLHATLANVDTTKHFWQTQAAKRRAGNSAGD